MSDSMWSDGQYDYVRLGEVVLAFKRDLEQEKEEKRFEMSMKHINRTQSILLGFLGCFVAFDLLFLAYLIIGG